MLMFLLFYSLFLQEKRGQEPKRRDSKKGDTYSLSTKEDNLELIYTVFYNKFLFFLGQ